MEEVRRELREEVVKGGGEGKEGRELEQNLEETT